MDEGGRVVEGYLSTQSHPLYAVPKTILYLH